MGRMLMISLTLLVVACAAIPVEAAPLITAVERRNPDANSGDTEVVLAPGLLADGSVTFADRVHVYKNIPEALVGAEYIMTANDDKDNPTFELHVTIGKACTLYLLLDNRTGTNSGGEATNPSPTAAGMTWVTQMGFVDSGLNIALDEAADGTLNNYFSLFSKQVTPGVVVLKALNDTFTGGPGSRNMYAVAAAAPRVKASKPSPADGEQAVIMPLFQWTAGTTAVLHNVYLGTSPELTEANLVGPKSPMAVYFHGPGLVAGTTYYWRVDEIEADMTTVHTGDLWSFTAAYVNAFQPVPADGTKWVDPGVELKWKAGKDAISHDLYFSKDKAAVENADAAAFQKNLYLAIWKPAALETGATYYWRVDEIVADGTKKQGAVWSFTTIPAIAVDDANLLAWWKMDEGAGATLVDWSGHGRHAVFASPAPKWATGHFGGAIECAGGGDSAVCADGSFLNGLGALTVSAWVKSDVTNTDKGFIIFEGPAGNDNRDMRYDAAGSTAGGAQVIKLGITVAVDASTNSTLQIESSNGVQVTEWQHLTMVWSSSQPLQLFINGNLDTPTAASTAATGTTTGNSTVIIGRAGKDTPGSWDGLIDEIRIYDKALTAEAIRLVMRGDPLLAWDPSPSNGVTTDAVSAVPLTWQAGDNAAKHDVYLGVDQAAVDQADASDATGIYRGRQSGTSFTPGESLVWGQKYFWRIDEVRSDGSISRGFVWSFTLANYLIVDEFETYTTDEGNRIYEAWLDGYADQSSGSIVGHLDPPFVERTIVHGGRQSMPLYYDNSSTPYYSEAELTFSSVQDWTVGGVGNLVLYGRGYPSMATVAVAETGGKISLTGAGADIWGNSDQFTYAYKTLNGDGSMIARVVSNGTGTNTWAKGGVMIRDNLNGGSTHAMMVMTGSGGNGASFQYRATTNGVSAGTDSTSVIAPPYWVKVERVGDTLTGYVSADGKSWSIMSSTIITMETPVHIGLAVTSHVAGTDRTFQFDSISSTGAVSGAWQGAVISASTHNSAQPLYVTVEDSAGKKATATNADVVGAAAWTEFKIPLSSLAGVNLSKVKRLYLGVGDRNAPQADGNGLIYVDDIRLTLP